MNVNASIARSATGLDRFFPTPRNWAQVSGWFCECLDDARFNEGQASEEAQHLHELRELGLDVVADDPCVIAHGKKELKQLIDSMVREALCKSYDDCEADEWLALLHEPLQTKNAPHDSA